MQVNRNENNNNTIEREFSELPTEVTANRAEETETALASSQIVHEDEAENAQQVANAPSTSGNARATTEETKIKRTTTEETKMKRATTKETKMKRATIKETKAKRATTAETEAKNAVKEEAKMKSAATKETRTQRTQVVRKSTRSTSESSTI